MKIGVYGVGAIGGYVAANLAAAGHDVSLIARPVSAETLNQTGLQLDQTLEEKLSPPLRQINVKPVAFGSLAAAAPLDVIMIAVKSYDIDTIIDDIQTNCPDVKTVMALQNGIGIEEKVIRAFGANRVVAGSVTTPVSKRANGVLTVEKAGRGITLAPALAGDGVAQWSALFEKTGIRVTEVANFQSMKWSKALLNIIGNASSAILDTHPGQIYADKRLFNMEADMLVEALTIMKRQNIDVVNLPGASAKQLATATNWLPRPILKRVLTGRVSKGRGNKMPSFHIDLAAGKSKSEVLFHNVAIAKAGAACGVATPVNTVLGDTLLGLVSGQLVWEDFQRHPERLLSLIAAKKG